MTSARAALAAVVIATLGVAVAAQPPEPAVHTPATLVYANRTIVEFRGVGLFRPPAERVRTAVQFLDRLVDDAPRARVTTTQIPDGIIVRVGETPVFALVPADVNTDAGETLEGLAAAVTARLQQAFDEAVELRNPSRLIRAGLLALGATLLFAVLLWLVFRGRRAATQRLNQTTERQLERLRGGADVVRSSKLPEALERGLGLISLIAVLVLTYWWLSFVLRQFPYTRPVGESLRAVLFGSVATLVRRVIDSLPDLLMVVLIILATRFVIRLATYFFEAVEHGRIEVPWLFPETAQPTRRIVVALLWLLATVVAYPYMPGSSSDAFKGVTVFVGLMVSLGSTGIMNQVMSGLTITYSRAFRVGDFVRIGEIEGTVTHLGVLSLKIKTGRREEITIPNAIAVSASTTNYSRFAEREGVQVSTSVSIGYDTPWRQVEALLLLAAERTRGIRRDPPPDIRKADLNDFYVVYTLLVCLEHPHLRVPTLHALHGNILDAFNEYGVQITSPNYEADPERPKVVPRSEWFAAPAVPPADPPAGDPAAKSDVARSVIRAEH
jgi:small-conductance mechanosensitive channel